MDIIIIGGTANRKVLKDYKGGNYFFPVKSSFNTKTGHDITEFNLDKHRYILRTLNFPDFQTRHFLVWDNISDIQAFDLLITDYISQPSLNGDD